MGRGAAQRPAAGALSGGDGKEIFACEVGYEVTAVSRPAEVFFRETI